jgi:transcription antitermination factor NusG
MRKNGVGRRDGSKAAKGKAAAGFKAGQRVKVLAGDFGNAAGTVEEVIGNRARVLIDAQAHAAAETFALSNLAAL